MAIQIANPTVVEKVERLASLTGLNKTAAVEIAVDRLLEEAEAGPRRGRFSERAARLLAQIDAIPDRVAADDPLEWDELGLPK